MTQKPHILIAEDDFEDRYIMNQTFTELGLGEAIKFVEDGSILIDYLAETGAEPVGLIVLDLNMPRLNGTETLRILKNDPRYSKIPVIIFSTSINEIEKSMCLQLGASDYITKPSKYQEYVDTCNKFFTLSAAYKNTLPGR